MSTLASEWSKTDAADRPALSEFAADVRCGLLRPGQKELGAKYFYDDLGTSLFEAITQLPEYGLTRADLRLLRRLAADLPKRIAGVSSVAELGSGTGHKARFILEALQKPRYFPIDVSRAALDQCQRDLSGIAEVHPILSSYLPGLDRISTLRHASEPLLVLFLGSTIGNFSRSAALTFLGELRRYLHAGDALLLGADLVKPASQLLEAYDDPAGVTAAFNRNMLARLNRELGANFNLRLFQHEARYNALEQRVEMHLRSSVRQSVSIPGAGCTVQFEAGETIWTESSHKFELAQLLDMAARSGFHRETEWVDREWPFVETLWLAN